MATKSVKGKRAVATAMKNHKQQQKNVGKPIKIEGPAAEVRVDTGVTLNMGNMEFLRLGISLALPCAATASEIEKAYTRAVKYTETKLDKLIKESKRGGEPKEITDEDLLS